MKGKAARQHALQALIEGGESGTQEQLADKMRRQGFVVTQATMSRDLREMGIGKTRAADGRLVYSRRPRSAAGWPALKKMADSFVTSARAAGNLVVVKTIPGYAQGVAAAIDSLDDETLLGTIAGDDTILVVAAAEAPAQGLSERLTEEG